MGFRFLFFCLRRRLYVFSSSVSIYFLCIFVFFFLPLFLGYYKGALPFIVRGYKGGEVLSWLIEAFRSNKRLLHWQKERVGKRERIPHCTEEERASSSVGFCFLCFLLLGGLPPIAGIISPRCFFLLSFIFCFFVYAVGCMFFLPQLVFILYVFLFSSFCLCFWGII